MHEIQCEYRIVESIFNIFPKKLKDIPHQSPPSTNAPCLGLNSCSGPRMVMS